MPVTASAITGYAALVRRLFAERAHALVLCGPALDPQPPAGRRMDSVLVVAGDEIEPLRALAGHGRALAADGFAAPLIMPATAIPRMRDSFPLELLDLVQRRRLVFGDDPFAGLELDREHLRLQCERELRTLRIALRQRVLAAAGGVPSCGDLVVDVDRVLRGLLAVGGHPAQSDDLAVITAAETALRVELAPLRRAAAGEGGWEVYRALYAAVTALTAVADA